jgi:hypothetical protein
MGLAAAHEITPLTDLRLHQQVQVGGIDIGVTENTVLFARAAKAAVKLVFPVPPLPLIMTNSRMALLFLLEDSFYIAVELPEFFLPFR